MQSIVRQKMILTLTTMATRLDAYLAADEAGIDTTEVRAGNRINSGILTCYYNFENEASLL